MTQGVVLRLLGAVVLVHGSIGCASLLHNRQDGSPPVTDLRRYYGLVEGGEWEYDYFQGDGELINTTKIRHSDVRQVGSDTVTGVVTVDEFHAQFSMPNKKEYTYHYGSEQVSLEVRDLNIEGRPAWPPTVLLMGPLIAGTAWTRSANGSKSKAHFRIDGFETLETRYGRYKNALKVTCASESAHPRGNQVIYGKWEVWLVADIGKVRSLSTSSSSPSSERLEILLRTHRLPNHNDH